MCRISFIIVVCCNLDSYWWNLSINKTKNFMNSWNNWHLYLCSKFHIFDHCFLVYFVVQNILFKTKKWFNIQLISIFIQSKSTLSLEFFFLPKIKVYTLNQHCEKNLLFISFYCYLFLSFPSLLFNLNCCIFIAKIIVWESK